MKTALKYFGLVLLAAGLVAFVAVASGALDTWITDHWTCADGHGNRHTCGWWEAKGSALQLSGAAALGGLVAWALGSAGNNRNPDGSATSGAAFTVDLSRWTRR